MKHAKSEWIWAHQAWSPRFWPTALLGSTLAGAGVYVIATRIGGVVGAILAGLIITVFSRCLVPARWWLWERRHPRLSDEELNELYRAEQRASAPWN